MGERVPLGIKDKREIKKHYFLTPVEWSKKKRQLWESIQYFIDKNKENIGDIHKAAKIKTLILQYLKKYTNLLIVNSISGQVKTVYELTQQYIIAIWLMNKTPPAERMKIKKMTGLDYKLINQMADHLKVELPKAKTGKNIDPYLLQKILDAVQLEIQKYNLGLEPKSLNKIGEDLGINQSVISYWVKKEYPIEYGEIWGRDEDWGLSEVNRSLIIKEIKTEIQRYHNGQDPTSLNSITKKFSEDASYETIRKIVIDEFPEYYLLIWKSDYALSATQKKKLYKRLSGEIKNQSPTPLSKIGRDLEISYDMVRYYAKKLYSDIFDDMWGKPRLTEQETEAIQERFEQEIKKFEKYDEGITRYDNINGKFEIIKNEAYKPDPITEIANNFNRSYDTISRIFTKTHPKKYDEIYAKPRLTEAQLESIISDILCSNIPQTGIAEKHNVSTGTVSKISLDKVQPNYDDYEHSERFPHDVYQQLGTAAHQIIQCISTEHLLLYDIHKFSEIPDGNYTFDDLLPCIEMQKFYNEIIKKNKGQLSLWEKIGLNICEYNEIVFEYTSYISKKHIWKKTKKYIKPKRMLLFVGTRWYAEKYPNPIIHTRFNNVTIIRYDIFAALIGLSDILLKEFKNAIELNYNYDLDGMNTFKEEITGKYRKLGFPEYENYRNRLH